jgi:hypothetical protein
VARPDTLWFGVYASGSSFGYLNTGPDQSITIDVAYDVTALTADRAIGGHQIYASSYYGGFFTGYLGVASLSTTLDDDVLNMLVLDYASGIDPGQQSSLLAAPADRVRVHHKVEFANGSAFGGFNAVTLQATVVPAPGSVGLLALSLTVLGGYGRRRWSTARIPSR